MEWVLFYLFAILPIMSCDPVPFIMVAWGTIMSLMCLVNSYHGLVMYTIRFTHLYLYSF